MDILKTASDWAKDEVFSSVFFILFGVLFASASIGFWKLGKTEVAKAFTAPGLVAALFLLAVGLGLFFLNKSRATSFPADFNQDAAAFVESELIRTEKSLNEYQMVVFRIIPCIVVVAALLILLVDRPLWRAISITAIATMAVIMVVDSNAHARLKVYHDQLELVEHP